MIGVAHWEIWANNIPSTKTLHQTNFRTVGVVGKSDRTMAMSVRTVSWWAPVGREEEEWGYMTHGMNLNCILSIEGIKKN